MNFQSKKSILFGIVLLIIATVLLISLSVYAQETDTYIEYSGTYNDLDTIQHYYYDVDNEYTYDYGPKNIYNSTFDDSKILDALNKAYDNMSKYNLHSMINMQSSETLKAISGKSGFRQTVRFSTDTNLTFLNYGAGQQFDKMGWHGVIGIGFDRVTNDNTLFAAGGINF